MLGFINKETINMGEKLRYSESNGLSEIEFAVVGVTFDNRQEILKEIYQDFLNKIKIPVYVEKEPNNEYDPNAVKVVLKNTNQVIGYVSKEFNEDIGEIIENIKEAFIVNMYMNRTRNMGVIVKIVFES